MATEDDAAALRRLFQETPYGEMDWSDPFPFWLVAEKDGKVVAALNVAISKPIGRLDPLALDPELNTHAKARITRAITLEGFAALKKAGCSACVSVVSFDMKPFKKVVKKHFGGVVVDQGNILMRGL